MKLKLIIPMLLLAVSGFSQSILLDSNYIYRNGSHIYSNVHLRTLDDGSPQSSTPQVIGDSLNAILYYKNFFQNQSRMFAADYRAVADHEYLINQLVKFDTVITHTLGYNVLDSLCGPDSTFELMQDAWYLIKNTDTVDVLFARIGLFDADTSRYLHWGADTSSEFRSAIYMKHIVIMYGLDGHEQVILGRMDGSWFRSPDKIYAILRHENEHED